MPFNAIGESFIPNGGSFATFPAITGGQVTGVSGMTAAQLVTAGFTAVSIGTTSTTLLAASATRKGLIIACPSDAVSAITIGNNNTLGGTIVAPTAITAFSTTQVPSTAGFTLAPGTAVSLAPFYDTVYGIATATQNVYYLSS